jgi:hypothetical protein
VFQVVVGAGIAYDCRGREIISARTVLLPPPAPPPRDDAAGWWYDLTVAYREKLSSAPDAVLLCAEDEAHHPREERPAFHWRLVGPAEDAGVPPVGLSPDVRLGDEIPLARFYLGQKRNLGGPDFSERRAAQGLVRPHIGQGHVAGTASFNFSRSCWTVDIDTSAAGFSETPHYFVTLAKHMALEPSGEIDDDGDIGTLQTLQGLFLNVRNPTRDGFTLEIRAAAAVTPGTAAMSTVAAVDRRSYYDFTWPVTVEWVGLEPTGGCPPEPIFLIYPIWNYIIWTPAIILATDTN